MLCVDTQPVINGELATLAMFAVARKVSISEVLQHCERSSAYR